MVSIVVYMRATELVTVWARDRVKARVREGNDGTENLTRRKEGLEENKKKWDIQSQWRGEDVWTGWKEKKKVELTFLQGSWEWRPAW